MSVLVIGFFIGFVTSIPPIGAVSAIIIRRAFTGRLRESFLFAVGATLSEGVYSLAAVFSIHLFFASVPGARAVLRWVAVGILLVVGLYFVFAPPAEEHKGTDATAGTKDVAAGFALAVSNPTMLASWLTIIGYLVSVHNLRFSSLSKWLFPVAVMAGDIAWYALFVAGMRRLRYRLPQSFVTWAIRGVGWILLGAAVWGALAIVR